MVQGMDSAKCIANYIARCHANRNTLKPEQLAVTEIDTSHFPPRQTCNIFFVS